MKYLFMTILLFVLVNGCGKANSDSTHSEIIPAPLVGYVCFAIKDNDGKTVGGNCVKD